MMRNDKSVGAKLLRDTRILYHIKDTPKYFITNDTGTVPELLCVFLADVYGKIEMEG